jgi:tetratricopeptide (TPR) repeat protein
MILTICALLLTSNYDPLYLESLYSRQDPKSLTKQLSFYAQYPDSKEGQRAKNKIIELLGVVSVDPVIPLELKTETFEELLNAVFKTTTQPLSLDSKAITFIDNVSKHHANRKLKGSQFQSIAQLEKASIEDIDVGRGMLLLAFGDSEEALLKIQTYEAVLDFMALCIKARLSPTSSSEDIIHEINHFIFYELGYRFPAHSEHEDRIDTYTVLPSVLDNRQGVCLGVSLLYYTLAQRIGLSLDIYTPPGHIFLSLNENLNIETTARGIHMPLERYLSLHVKKLSKRNQKELLGMALFNQASVFLRKQNFKEAASYYENALKYMPNDPQILELLGSCYFMEKEIKKANLMFSLLRNHYHETVVSTNFLVEDFFDGLMTPQSLKAIFQEVDDDLLSVLKKAKQLEEIVKKSPRSKSALFQLGVTYLQLHQYEKSFICLEKLYTFSKNDPAVIYYLTHLSLIRFDRPKTLYYQDKLKEILKKHNYLPEACSQLFEEIQELWPSRIDMIQPNT